jgi:insulysin
MQVLLVSDKLAPQSSAALTIGGAGQFSDPPDLLGLAHLMEHMSLSSRKNNAQRDFEEWLNDYDGASNGFTAYEKVCFHFNCPPPTFPEALERFARLFLQEAIQKVCRNEETLKREVRRINSELDHTNDFTKELYLIKSLVNPEHPYSRMTMGNLETLETIPAQKGINVGNRLFSFFQLRYQPRRAILVVVSPSDLASLESWVAPFASTLSREPRAAIYTEQQQRVFPEAFPRRTRSISTLCLFRLKVGNPLGVGEDLEKLSFHWPLSFDYSGLKQQQQQGGRTATNVVTATQIGFVISQILGRRGPGSLYTLLKRRHWIPDGSQGLPRVSFPVDVSGFQMMKLELSLTLQGFSSRSAVIAAVYDSINSIQLSPLSRRAPFFLRRELIAEYVTVAQLYGYVLAPRPPDAIELAMDGQVYGIDGVGVVSNSEEWHCFPSPQDIVGVSSIQKSLKETLDLMSDPGNAIIIATASKKSILYSLSNNDVFVDTLPRMSPASWNISPVTDARYYNDNMFRLTGRVNEWLVARSMEDALSAPVLNPLIPPLLRPARVVDKLGGSVSSSMGKPFLLDNESTEKKRPALSWTRILQRNSLEDDDDEEVNLDKPDYNEDPTQTSIVRDYWVVLQVMGLEKTSRRLPLPRVAPEPSCRCLFVLQLLSSRPARASVTMAAHAELWKMSFEYAVADLVR